MSYGKLNLTPEELQDAARKYRKELLMLVVLGAKETLQHMTGRPGIRHSEMVGDASFEAQLGPHDVTYKTAGNLDVVYRELRTYLGSCVKKFDPTSALKTLLGQGVLTGEGLKNNEVSKLVLSLMSKKIGKHLNSVIWSAVRNPNGHETKDLFDGFDTITAKEITAGTISATHGNYEKLTTKITRENCCDVFKQILFNLSEELRDETCYMYIPRQLADLYNESYQLTHGFLPYNKEYKQIEVEGSEGKLILRPMSSKKGSNFIHITTKGNMLYGYDNMSNDGDVKVGVEKHDEWLLSFVAAMFFGVQFETIDARRFKVIELADESSEDDNTDSAPGESSDPAPTSDPAPASADADGDGEGEK